MPRLRLPVIARSMALTALAALVVAGCGAIHSGGQNTTQIGSAPYTEGSGNVATDTRSLAPFMTLDVQRGLSVSVSRGSADSAKVTADDNLLSMITTEVLDGILLISVRGSLSTHSQLKVEVTTTQSLATIRQDSGSTVDTQDLSGATLSVSVKSGSTFRGGGGVTELTLSVSSGSTADTRNLETQRAHVTVTSGSTAIIRATQSVDGSCNSGSTLKVSGGGATSGVQKDTSSTVTTD